MNALGKFKETLWCCVSTICRFLKMIFIIIKIIRLTSCVTLKAIPTVMPQSMVFCANRPMFSTLSKLRKNIKSFWLGCKRALKTSPPPFQMEWLARKSSDTTSIVPQKTSWMFLKTRSSRSKEQIWSLKR